MNLETTKNDTAPGIEDKFPFTLVGDRILILLDKVQTHSTTEAGIIVPLTKTIETEGGRLGSEISDRTHLNKGTVIALGTTAYNKLQDLDTTVTPSTRVYVSPQATSKNHYFYPDRDTLIENFEGYICIPHTFIEAVIN